MNQPRCAVCWLPIRSLYQGRLMLPRDFNPYRNIPGFTIHHVCEKKWERGNDEAYMWFPLHLLQGGR
jgi:hypothetical protein